VGIPDSIRSEGILFLCLVIAKNTTFCNYEFGVSYTISKSKMILRRLGEGDEEYFTRVTSSDLAPPYGGQVIRLYVEEADNDANKNSALI
jgi:hypothetical protein